MDGLDLTIADATGRLAGPIVRPQRLSPHRRRRHPLRWLAFLLVVVLPTAAATVYYFGFAAYQYVSEARFVVRGASIKTPNLVSSLMESTGIGGGQSNEDTYAVEDYILSRDALRTLIQQDNLRAIYERPEADRLSRFPMALLYDDTFEHLYKYYLKHVEVDVDATTGVSKLTVKAFRADDAQRLAQALLAAAEHLVNQMNDRQRENALRDARKEVTLAEQRIQSTAMQMAQFRNRAAVLDPTKQSVPILQGVAELQMRLAQTQIEISQLTASSPQSPLIAAARQRAIALQAQIDAANRKVTGGDQSLVPKITEFDQLVLQQTFAEKQLASATLSLETARMDAERQQLYLDTIVQPNAPDYAAYPKRFVDVAVVFASVFGIFVMGSLIIAGAREHRDI